MEEKAFCLLAQLRKLATHCNLGGNLKKALRDKLVCGFRNMQIQKRLLSEAKLKYSKAVEIAVAMETTTRNASELQSELNANPIPHVDKMTHTIVFTRIRFATTLENRAISSEFVVPNSKASLSKQPEALRYMLLRLMLMLTRMKTS